MEAKGITLAITGAAGHIASALLFYNFFKKLLF